MDKPKKVGRPAIGKGTTFVFTAPNTEEGKKIARLIIALSGKTKGKFIYEKIVLPWYADITK